MDVRDVRLVVAGSCDDDALLQAAALVYSSLPAYYDLFGISHHVVAKLFRGTSLEDAVVAVTPKGVAVGVVAGHDVSDLRRRSYAELQQLMRAVLQASRARVRDAVSAHALKVAPPAAVGRYLARFAVAPSMRGIGLADLLLDRFELDGDSFSLHVHRDNARAIQFYRRRGYSFVGPEVEYRVMTRQKR